MRNVLYLEQRTKELLLSLFLLFVLSVFFVQAKPALKFTNGKFKIVQFTDLHWINSIECIKNNDSTLNLMKHIIRIEKPDLVVLTGDIVVSSGAEESWKEISGAFNDLKIPFAVTFGNHDTEADITKEQALRILQNSPYNLTCNDDETLSGVGNCALPIKSSDGKSDKWVMYLFDSHSYPKDSIMGTYDWIQNDQIQWYRSTNREFARKNSRLPSSLLFFHIPIPEYEIIRNKKSTVGNTTEEVCSPLYNSGLFTTLIEMNNVMGVFVGHDHNDDYAGILAKICLAYGRKTGYNSAYEEVLERGARVIDLYENEHKFDTYIRTLRSVSLFFTHKR